MKKYELIEDTKTIEVDNVIHVLQCTNDPVHKTIFDFVV